MGEIVIPREAACRLGYHGPVVTFGKVHFAPLRFIYVVAAVGMAIAVQFIAPVVLASPAHADDGIDDYARCVSDAGLPPRQRAEDWVPTVRMIEFDLNSALSPAQVAQMLVSSGVKPNDAAAEVQCARAVPAAGQPWAPSTGS